MRTIKKDQMKIDQVNIADIRFDPRSRDEIPQLLRGLQHIFCTPDLREQVFAVLERMIPKKVDKHNGRPGMELWKILVLGTLRLNCNWNYDTLQEMTNHHNILRKMLGHAGWEDETHYPLQTLKDNVRLLTPEVLEEINRVVVEAGHQLVKKREKEAAERLRVRCDSFVVETNVHYPTNANLLYDAVRKVITLTNQLCQESGVAGFRKASYAVRKVHRLYRQVVREYHRKGKKGEDHQETIQHAYQRYVREVGRYLDRAEEVVEQCQTMSWKYVVTCQAILFYLDHAQRQMDQIHRRIFLGEKIPQEEKVFSVFEDHTEWISKGKAGVPQELGLKVAVMEDQHGFFLHHRVMVKEEDVHVLLPMLEKAKQWYPGIVSCSVDKGFYNPDNKKKAKKLVSLLVMPKKGKLSQAEQAEEGAEAFRRERRKRSAVESAINALENHGLDRCPDHGLRGFERYVSLAIVARNLQMVGTILLKRELRRIQRKQKGRNKIAA